VLVRTPWKPIIHHSVAVKIGEETHTVYMVEENTNTKEVYARHHRRETRLSEEIPSDDNDSDTPYSRWSVLSLGIIDVEHSDGALARRTEKEPTGGQGVEDPLGIDQCGMAQSSRSKRCVTEEVRCHIPDSAVQPSGDVVAGCEEKERSIGQEFGKLDTKGAACVRVSKESMASSSAEEQSMNLAQGQKETGIKCPNGSQHFFIIEDPVPLKRGTWWA